MNQAGEKHGGREIQRTAFPAGRKGEFSEVDISRPQKVTGGRVFEPDTYVISKIDSRNKESLGYGSCSFVVGFGTDTNTAIPISFLTHQNPSFFLSGKGKERFLKDLRETLRVFLKSTDRETRKIMIGGGNYAEKHHILMRRKYRKSIELLSQIIKEECGEVPSVIIGPNTAGKTDVRIDTTEQKIYFSRNEQPNPNSNKHMSVEETLGHFPLKVAGILSLRRSGIQAKLKEVLLGD